MKKRTDAFRNFYQVPKSVGRLVFNFYIIEFELYLNTQSVPHNKHSPSLLYKPVS
jgi:hypothetical protein